MAPLAIIPARAGSKGIPGKNFRQVGGMSLVGRAVQTANDAGCDPLVTTDAAHWACRGLRMCGTGEDIEALILPRPPELAQDDTPMIAVIQHVLARVPEGDPIVLLQPTQPLRTVAHVHAALARLTPDVDSVVSVVEVPPTHHPWMQFEITPDGQLEPEGWEVQGGLTWPVVAGFGCRQEMPTTYRRDGTVYAFWRRTVARSGTIYGSCVVPLVIPPEETCDLDTEADWAALEARWARR